MLGENFCHGVARLKVVQLNYGAVALLVLKLGADRHSVVKCTHQWLLN